MTAAPCLDLAPLAVPVEQLRAWAAAAQAGHRAVYAKGRELPRDHESVQQVSRWIREGLVTATEERDPQDRERRSFIVIMGKKNSRSGDAGPSGSTGSGRAEVLTLAERKLLDLLADRARCKRPTVPSNGELMMALELHSRTRVQRMLDRLQAAGRIAVVSHGRNAPRTFTLIKGKAK